MSLLLWDVYRQLTDVAKIEGDIAETVPLRASSRVYRSENKHPRARKLWIKSRSLEGLPQAKGNNAFSTFYKSTSWWHWALEVGPWTIEVVLEGKLLSKMAVRRTHHADCHEVWENEESRVCVGETTMSDEYIDIVRRRVAEVTPTYDLQTMNCQTIAATLAVLISDDGWQTWDSLVSLEFFNNVQSLFVPLVNLQYNYETKWRDARMQHCLMQIAKALRQQVSTQRELGGERIALVNSLIGNFHSWSAMVRNQQRPTKSRRDDDGEPKYPLARLMDFIDGTSKVMLKATGTFG